jgi:hypothetical protein
MAISNTASENRLNRMEFIVRSFDANYGKEGDMLSPAAPACHRGENFVSF